jgi:Domain of unknown function (DUF4398)
MTHSVQLSKARRTRRSSLHLSLRLVFAVAGVLTFAACASAPQPPTQALQAAELAIANADQARVADYASPELIEAREKLNAARSAVEQDEMVLAQRLAEESRVDAELASAKAETSKALAINEEMQKSNDALKQEMQRNTGARQ